MDKKKLIDKIINANHLAATLEASFHRQSCGEHSSDDFDSYWEGLLSEEEAQILEAHCLDCTFCIQGLAKAWEIHEKTEEIAEGISENDLNLAASRLLRRQKIYHGRIEKWAAAAERKGRLGLAAGVAISSDGKKGALIECSAWVGNDNDTSPKLELLGRQVEGDSTGTSITGSLDYLEEKLENLFKTIPMLEPLHLNSRYISVDLKEKILSEANSLTLTIVMAVVNAIFRQKEAVSLAYSADLRQDGKLENVGKVKQKLKAARELGIREFILPKESEPDCPPEFLSDSEFKIIFFDNIAELFDHFGLFPPVESDDDLEYLKDYEVRGIQQAQVKPAKRSVILVGIIFCVVIALALLSGVLVKFIAKSKEPIIITDVKDSKPLKGHDEPAEPQGPISPGKPEVKKGKTENAGEIKEGERNNEKNRLQGELMFFKKILASDETNDSAHFKIGLIYYQMGELEKAFVEMKQASKLNPQHPGYHYNLGLVLSEMRRLDEAVSEWQNVLELEPNNEKALMLIEMYTKSR